MSLYSFLMPLLIALIAVCGTAEVSWTEAVAQKWPDQAQLKRQIQQCHLSKPPEGIPANEARAATLDYENQCYRQLADIGRVKLDALEEASRRMAKSPNPTHRIHHRWAAQRQPFAISFQATR